MLTRFAVFALAATLALSGASKKPKAPPTSRGENQDLILTATLYLTPADVKELIGDDLGGHYIVCNIKVQPKYGKDIVLDRDDFVLWTDKNGEHTQPYVGSQIAGRGALIIGTVEDNQGVASPGWTGTRVPVVRGGGASAPPPGKDTATAKKPAPEPALQKTLDARILPEGKTTEPVSGLLYFPLEKQKMKDLELVYGDKDNKIRIRFKQQ